MEQEEINKNVERVERYLLDAKGETPSLEVDSICQLAINLIKINFDYKETRSEE